MPGIFSRNFRVLSVRVFSRAASKNFDDEEMAADKTTGYASLHPITVFEIIVVRIADHVQR